MRTARLVRTAVFYVALALFLVVILLPIYYVLMTASVPGDRLFTQPLTYVPAAHSLERFEAVFAAEASERLAPVGHPRLFRRGAIP